MPRTRKPADATPAAASARKRRGLYLSLTAEQDDALDRYTRSSGESAAALGRRVLAQLIQATSDDPRPIQARGYVARTARRTLRLTPAESDLVDALALRHGTTSHGYVVGVLRTALLKAPQPTEPEIAALDASTHQLKAIGVNLNQVVRRLNEAPPGQIPAGLADAIQRVKDHLAGHTASVDRLIKARLERWT